MKKTQVAQTELYRIVRYLAPVLVSYLVAKGVWPDWMPRAEVTEVVSIILALALSIAFSKVRDIRNTK